VNVCVSFPDFKLKNPSAKPENPKAFIRLSRAIRFNLKSGNQEREKREAPFLKTPQGTGLNGATVQVGDSGILSPHCLPTGVPFWM
jgi:hypothetical protein